MAYPAALSLGQSIRWTPIGRAQEAAQSLWGIDVWIVVNLPSDEGFEPSSTLVVIAPVDGGRLRRGFAQTLRLSQIEG